MDAIQAWFTAHYDVLHDFAGPVATIIAASVAFYVTWRLGRSQLAVAQQQAELAAIRLQHDLFDRRFKAYDTARALAFEVVTYNNVSTVALSSFIAGASDTVFLFDADITEYLDDMRQRAIRMQQLVDMLNNPAGWPAEEVTMAPAERAELGIWFFDQFTVLVEKFKPFLVLDNRNFTPRPPST